MRRAVHVVGRGALFRGLDLGAHALELIDRSLIVRRECASGVGADENVDGVQYAAQLSFVAGYLLDDPAFQRGIAAAVVSMLMNPS